MQTERWNVRKAQLWGATLGVLYTIANEMLISDRAFQVGSSEANLTFGFGLLLGGAIGGAFIFSLVAWSRNKILKV